MKLALVLAACAVPYAAYHYAVHGGHASSPWSFALAALLLGIGTWALALPAMSYLMARSLREAVSLYFRALRPKPFRLRAQEVQEIVATDAGMRAASGPRTRYVACSAQSAADPSWEPEASESTRAALAAAFADWTGRHIGTVTVAVEPLPESATLRAAIAAKSRKIAENLPNRAKGPSFQDDEMRES